MRILQVHNRYRERGGEDSVVAAEAGLLRDACHDVVQYQVENPPSGIGVAGTLALAPWNPAAARRVRSLIEDVRPDVAHVHNTWYSLSPSVLRSLHQGGVPVVMTLHNYRLVCANALLFRSGAPCELCVGSHPWHGVRHRCYRGSAAASTAAAATIAVNRRTGTWQRHVDVFLALTEFAKRTLVEGGLPAQRVIVKPNFVADPGPRPAPPSASNVVLFVGRLYEPKGIRNLVEAWRRAASPELELVIVGDGPSRQDLERGAAPRVRFAGAVPQQDVVARMRSSRALMFPTELYEGQPVSLLEALSAGLPVVASDHGGVAATLAGTDSWMVPAGDAAGWRDAIARLADGDGLDTSGQRARTAYEEAFTPAHALEGLVAAYERAVDGFARRRRTS